VPALVDAIRRLVVRGAPLLGVAGAFGVALAAYRGDDVARAAAVIGQARPTRSTWAGAPAGRWRHTSGLCKAGGPIENGALPVLPWQRPGASRPAMPRLAPRWPRTGSA